MAITIQNVYIETFERNLRHLAQQSVTRLRQYVTERPTTGESHNWERLGPSAATQKTSARTATPRVDVPWSRRVSTAQTWHNADTVEQEDIVQMLIDPNSNVTMNLAMSMKRAVDDIVISAATGNATDGAGASVAFPASQTVGDGSGAITLDFVSEVAQKFHDNDIDPSVPKVFIISPRIARQLIQITEAVNADYVNAKALAMNGVVTNWMGFDWVVSTRLTGATGERDCLAFTKQAIGLQVNRDIFTKVAEDPTISFAWAIYCAMTMGAVRVEDEHIVRARLADSSST